MNEPLDQVDLDILDGVRTVHRLLDPPPVDLNARSMFAIRLTNVDFEVSRLSEDTLVGSAARTVERIRTITFETESLTVMMTVSEQGERLVRVEGWLAPPGPPLVELRVAESPNKDQRGVTREVVPDESGRFVFDEVPTGLAQLAVYRGADEAVVVTSPMILG